jgi:hypothetical protein
MIRFHAIRQEFFARCDTPKYSPSLADEITRRFFEANRDGEWD